MFEDDCGHGREYEDDDCTAECGYCEHPCCDHSVDNGCDVDECDCDGFLDLF